MCPGYDVEIYIIKNFNINDFDSEEYSFVDQIRSLPTPISSIGNSKESWGCHKLRYIKRDFSSLSLSSVANCELRDIKKVPFTLEFLLLP